MYKNQLSSVEWHKPMPSVGNDTYNKYQEVKVIGIGGGGKVTQRVSPSGEHVAVKVSALNKSSPDDDALFYKSRTQRELACLRYYGLGLSHPLLDMGEIDCLYVDAQTDKKDEQNKNMNMIIKAFFYVMDLLNEVKDKDTEFYKLPSKEKVIVMYQVLNQLHAMHKLGLLHRGIKLGNTVIGYKNKKIQGELVDFGSTLELATGETEKHAKDGRAIEYHPPEAYLDRKFSYDASTYSWGWAFFQLLEGEAMSKKYFKDLGYENGKVPKEKYHQLIAQMMENIRENNYASNKAREILAKNSDSIIRDLADVLGAALEGQVNQRLDLPELKKALEKVITKNNIEVQAINIPEKLKRDIDNPYTELLKYIDCVSIEQLQQKFPDEGIAFQELEKQLFIEIGKEKYIARISGKMENPEILAEAGGDSISSQIKLLEGLQQVNCN